MGGGGVCVCVWGGGVLGGVGGVGGVWGVLGGCGGVLGGRVKCKTQNIRCLNLHGSEKLYSVSVLM